LSYKKASQLVNKRLGCRHDRGNMVNVMKNAVSQQKDKRSQGYTN
jgi:hypothetical protein